MNNEATAPTAETAKTPVKEHTEVESETKPKDNVDNGNDVVEHEEKLEKDEASVEEPKAPTPPALPSQKTDDVEMSNDSRPEESPPQPPADNPGPVEDEKSEAKEAVSDKTTECTSEEKSLESEKKETFKTDAGDNIDTEAKPEASDDVKSKDEDSKKDDEDVKEDEPKDPFDMMVSGENEEKSKWSSDTKLELKDESVEDDKKESTEAVSNILNDILETIEISDSTETPEPPKVEEDVVINIDSEKVPDDTKFFEDMNEEELTAIKENVPRVDTVIKPHCTTCKKHLLPVFRIKGGTFRHPHLGVIICEGCRKFYGDGDWERPEETDEYCRWCGQGGNILLCDKCPNAFCKGCLTRHLGSKSFKEINDAEYWECLVCEPKPILSMKAQYYCLFVNQEDIKQRHEKEKAEKAAKAASKRRSTAKSSLAKEKESLIKSPKNFLEQNISEAFKTLDVYQKSLEAERTNCIRLVKDGISVEMAISITRKLRKLYAVTQKNMDLLDRAIVETFIENFPTESTRIHMGRVPRNDPSPRKAPPAKKSKLKIKSKSGSKSKTKKKSTVKNAKGKKAADAKKKKKKKKTIHMNGSPVYDVVTPSLIKKKKKRSYDDEVECIDLSDDDYAPAKKKSRPGPASSKKRKPGPRSKTGDWD